MKFRGIVELHRKTATGISVPKEVVTSLGGSKRPKVRITINGYTYRTSVGSMSGQLLLPVSAQVREGAAITAGDAKTPETRQRRIAKTIRSLCEG